MASRGRQSSLRLQCVLQNESSVLNLLKCLRALSSPSRMCPWRSFGRSDPNGQQRAEFCEIQTRLTENRPMCRGRRKGESLIQYWTRSDPKDRPSLSKASLIHANCDELNSCAEKFIICRVRRRGHTPRAKHQRRGKVQARGYAVECLGHNRGKRGKSGARCEPGSPRANPQRVNQWTGHKLGARCLLPCLWTTSQVSITVQGWDKERQSHQACGSLTSPTRDPTRLPRIRSPSSIQLVETKDKSKANYTTLSYCWGDPCQDDRILPENVLGRRQQPFVTMNLASMI